MITPQFQPPHIVTPHAALQRHLLHKAGAIAKAADADMAWLIGPCKHKQVAHDVHARATEIVARRSRAIRIAVALQHRLFLFI